MAGDRKVTALLALSLLCVTGLGCHRQNDGAGPAPQVTLARGAALTTPSPSPQSGSLYYDPQPAEASARAALLSIYYYAYVVNTPEPNEPLPMSLSAAIAALRDDTSPRGDTRRRRAIAVLVGKFAEPQATPTPVEWTNAAVVQGLTNELKAPIRSIEKEINALPIVTQDTKEIAAYKAMDEAIDAAEHSEQTPGPFNRLCCSCTNAYRVDSVGADPGMGHFKIWVKRPYADVKPLMDPQTWATCDPAYFVASYVSGSKDCTTNGGVAEPNPPTPGTPWSAVFYEDFRLTLSGSSGSSKTPVATLGPSPTPNCATEIRFQTKLNVATYETPGSAPTPTGTPPQSSYEADFQKCNSISHGEFCGTPQPDGIMVDCGFTKATSQTDGTTIVAGVKYLEFSSAVVGFNNWVNAGLRAMIDAIRDEGVCCGYQGTTQGCPSCGNPDTLKGRPPCPTPS